jgi:ATP-binding cassette subfamily F protein 2
MPPSASKQKRLAEKAAKQASKSNALGSSVTSSTPPGSTNGGSSINTPMSSLSAATSQEDLTSMAKLQIATERSAFFVLYIIVCPLMSPLSRSATGVLVSDPKGRDIKIDAYTLSFHGRLLIENAEIALNYGQRYGLLGENGSGKVCLCPLSSGITSHLVPVDIPAIHRLTRYTSPTAYRHLSCPWRG